MHVADLFRAETDEPEPATPEAIGASISKTQAVREAVDAKFDIPDEGIEFIRSNFGIEMDKGHFNAVKSTHKESRAEKAKPAGRLRAAANGHVASAAESFSKGEADLIGTLETLKPLMAAMGVERIRRLIDLVGRPTSETKLTDVNLHINI